MAHDSSTVGQAVLWYLNDGEQIAQGKSVCVGRGLLALIFITAEARQQVSTNQVSSQSSTAITMVALAEDVNGNLFW